MVALILGYTTSLFVHVAGEAAPAVPLFVPEGIAVELAFLARRGPVTAGALAGTLGFAGEWAWTHVAMPIAWTPALLPEAAIMAVAAGIAGARDRRRARRRAEPRGAAPLGGRGRARRLRGGRRQRTRSNARPRPA